MVESPRRPVAWSQCALVAGAALALGCLPPAGSQSGGAPAKSSDVATVTDGASTADGTGAKGTLPATCGLNGPLVVQEASGPGANCAGILPTVGDSVTLGAGADGVPFLALGPWQLPLTSAQGCSGQFAGCAADAGHWVSAKATLAKTDGVLTLTVTAEAIGDHQLKACPASVTYKLAPPGPCRSLGRWSVQPAPKVSQGACSYGWPAGIFTVATADKGQQLTWAAVAEPFAVTWNATNCRGHAEPVALWAYNGAARTVAIDWEVKGDALAGTIADSLDKPSDNQETCAATFAFAAVRAAPDALGLPSAVTPICPPRPYACGDGECSIDSGEACDLCPQDCPCSGESKCFPGYGAKCQIPCKQSGVGTGLTHVCPDGQRCNVVWNAAGTDYKPLCAPGGPGSAGVPCGKSAECAVGLYCYQNTASGWKPSTVCAPLCPADPKQCATGCRDGGYNPLLGNGAVCPLGCERGKTGQCPAGAFCFDQQMHMAFDSKLQPATCIAIASAKLGAIGALCHNNFDGYTGTPCGDGLSCVATGTSSDTKGACRKACKDSDECPPFKCGSRQCPAECEKHGGGKWCKIKP